MARHCRSELASKLIVSSSAIVSGDHFPEAKERSTLRRPPLVAHDNHHGHSRGRSALVGRIYNVLLGANIVQALQSFGMLGSIAPILRGDHRNRDRLLCVNFDMNVRDFSACLEGWATMIVAGV